MISKTLLTQPRRPNVQPGKFVPILSPHTDPDTAKVTFGLLCHKCEVIQHWLDVSLATKRRSTVVEFEHHACVAALHESYISGCHLCALLWQSLGYLRIVPQSWMTETANVVTVRVTRDIADNTPVSLRVIVHRTGIIEGNELVVEKRHLSPFGREEEASGCHVAAYTAESRALISSWIQRCEKEHVECRRKFTGPVRYPTRILDVNDPDNEATVRLVDTAAWSDVRRYVTLSYCWGSPDGVKLTQKSLKDFYDRGIAVAKLPKTIRDAIQITKDLGFRWLWVDSLCIVQDDEEEWTREAEDMPHIYQRSFLSLGALGASDKVLGITGQRDPLIYAPCRLCNDPAGGGFYVWPVDSHYTTCFEKAPLHTRGWVAQERLLSPRTVNFGVSTIWECREATWDEYGFRSNDSADILQRKFGPSALEREAVIARWKEMAPKPSRSFMNSWFQFVESFSKAKFSKPSDRPIAVYGICEMIKEQTGWQHNMGLWIPFIQQQLLWSAETVNGTGPRLYSGLPTWSWLSRQHSVMVPILDWTMDSDVKILAPFQYIKPERKNEWDSPGAQPTLVLNLTGSIIPMRDLTKDAKRSRERLAYDAVDGPRGVEFFLPLIEGKASIAGLVLRSATWPPNSYARIGVLETFINSIIVHGHEKEVVRLV